jgi:hypothetical protein
MSVFFSFVSHQSTAGGAGLARGLLGTRKIRNRDDCSDTSKALYLNLPPAGMCREGPKDKQKRMAAMEKLHIFV